jgi:hypothetical protein
VQKDQDPPLSSGSIISCVYVAACKIHRKPQKNPKIAKLVLLETRFPALQLLFMKFNMKLNIFAPILNLSLKGVWYITSTF